MVYRHIKHDVLGLGINVGLPLLRYLKRHFVATFKCSGT